MQRRKERLISSFLIDVVHPRVFFLNKLLFHAPQMIACRTVILTVWKYQFIAQMGYTLVQPISDLRFASTSLSAVFLLSLPFFEFEF